MVYDKSKLLPLESSPRRHFNEKDRKRLSASRRFTGFHSTDQVFRDTFVKLNFGPHHSNSNNFLRKQHHSCEDLLVTSLNKSEETPTKETEDNINNNNLSEKKRLRKFCRKQDRKRSSRENVETCSFQKTNNNNNANKDDNNNNTNNAKLMTKDPAMSPVNLIGLKTNGHHYQEPHYEAIKDLSLKATFRISGSNSNNSTPEGSPKLHHHRKYILNSDALLAEKISPMLERKKKLSGGKKIPPLPKRNHSSSQFYVESAANNATVNANPIYGNTALNINTSPRREPCYTDVAFQNNLKNSTTQYKKQQHQVDHPYSEITPRPRRSERSSDTNNFYNDMSPTSSPICAIPSPFSSHRFFNSQGGQKQQKSNVVIDGSKSDGDLSDSDVLDVPRLYDRRRSRTGNGEELADPSRFYVTIPEKPLSGRRAVKQNYHSNAYEKDYVETIIRPRPSTTAVASEISSSRSSSVKSLTYENALLYRSSSEDDDEANDEPTYENPDLPRVTTYNNDDHRQPQPTYENNELLHDEAPLGYACVRQSSASTSSSDASDSNYNNIVFTNRNEQLQYANIDVNNRHLYDNLSSPELDSGSIKSRMYSVTKNSKYTEIDFTKSDGLREALNQLRAGDKSVEPELDAEYKIDLSHIKFTRSSDSKRNSKNLE